MPRQIFSLSTAQRKHMQRHYRDANTHQNKHKALVDTHKSVGVVMSQSGTYQSCQQGSQDKASKCFNRPKVDVKTKLVNLKSEYKTIKLVISVMLTREPRQGIDRVTIIQSVLKCICLFWDVMVITENLNMERKIQEIQRAQRQQGWKAEMGRLWWKCPRTRTTHRQLCNPHQPCLRIWCRGQNTNTRQCTNTKPH